VKVSGRAWGLAGGVVGAAAAGLTLVGVLRSRRSAAEVATERVADLVADEPLGVLAADRVRTVAADDGVSLSVEEIDPADGGEPELTVVFVHGYSLSRRCWHFQRRDLAALTEPRVHQVLFDLRGHGRSGRPPARSCTIEQLGRDLDTVIEAVAPTGPLVLVGHSMGGMTIMALAEARPELFADRVRAVALIATSAGEVARGNLSRPLMSRYNPLTQLAGQFASWQPGLVDRVRTAGNPVARQAVRRLAFGDRSVSPALVDFMVDMIGGTTVPVLTHFLNTLGTHDRIAALAGLRHCAVLVLGGDADQLTPFSHSERIAAELPDAELVRAPGAGHMVMLEQPELVTGTLVELLRSTRTRRTGAAR
jgi:pimeloyl-ACP methyl ester carboxylesterase